MLVAMKGHPGSGKSTLARSLAKALHWPLLDKDDVRDCTGPLHLALSASSSSPSKQHAALLNAMAYQVLWRMVETQLQMGLSIIVDSPLSRPSLFASAAALAAAYHSQLVVVECMPSDAQIWKQRLESRGAAAAAAMSLQDVSLNGCAGGWHKPRCWEDLQVLIQGYEGCYDYEVRAPARKLVVNTTSLSHSADAIADAVLRWLHSLSDNDIQSVAYIP